MRSPALLVDPYAERADDLRPGWTRSPLGLIVPPRARRRYDLPVAVELFSGAGGFGCGFHQAGFHVAAASDSWATAAATYMVNLARPGVKIYFDTAERERDFEAMLTKSFRLDGKRKGKKKLIDPSEDWDKLGPISVAGSGWISGQPASHPGCEHYFLYDVRALTGEMILDALGLDVGDVAVVLGGPPCQGFSAAGRRQVMDPRNSLVFEFARLVTEIQPRTFVMENVPGIQSMVTPEGIPVLDAFALACADGGYGDYDALRKAMAGAGDTARAAVRDHKKPIRGRSEPEDREIDPNDDDGPEQLDLWAPVAEPMSSIAVARWGQFLATRAVGRAIRAAAESEFPDGPSSLDFTGVQAVTVTFADELVAGLAAAGRRVYVTGANTDVREALERAVSRRTDLAGVTIDA